MSLEALFKELGIPQKQADKVAKKGIQINDLQNLTDEKLKCYFEKKDRIKLKNWISNVQFSLFFIKQLFRTKNQNLV